MSTIFAFKTQVFHEPAHPSHPRVDAVVRCVLQRYLFTDSTASSAQLILVDAPLAAHPATGLLGLVSREEYELETGCLPLVVELSRRLYRWRTFCLIVDISIWKAGSQAVNVPISFLRSICSPSCVGAKPILKKWQGSGRRGGCVSWLW